ncbi:MAG TPA: DUF885 domain-containing protein [Candidatus Thermoplasmatota archaeon]|nr:DUF885 domain-containing protein [Candidatus Thermoplasmatota archaeon]
MPASRFDALVDEVYRTQLRWSPSFATSLGVHEYDQLLADPSRAQVEREVSKQREWLAELERMGQSEAVPADRRVDLGAMLYTLRLGLFQATELRNWEKNPDLAMDLFDHLFALLVRDTWPLEKRLSAIAARLSASPAFFEAGRERFGENMPHLWVEIAMESAQAAPATLEAVTKLAATAPAALRADVERAVKVAHGSIAGHRDWLQDVLDARSQTIEGGWSIGADRMRRLVELRALGLSADEILARGHALVKEKEAEVQAAAEAVLRKAGEPSGDTPVQKATAVLARDHPETFADVLTAYRDSVRASRDFVGSAGIATLPENDRLDVIETPAYLRHIIPFAAYFPPARFEPTQLGVYMVTPRPVEQFPHAEIQNTTVHEGYPGHHLQLTMANANPSTARILVGATETIEGWAHYCEEMMFRHGYGAGEATRFVQAKDQLWRACRIVIDVRIHDGSMTFDQGVGMLVEKTGMPEDGARAELKRYTQTPGYQLSYLLGKVLIGELAAKAAARGLAQRQFHDRFLTAGSLPLGLLSRDLGLA